MNYDQWEPKKWLTDFSEVEWLFMESLIDTTSTLTITLSDNENNLFEITFVNHPAYRNIFEQYRLNLWGIRDKNWPGLGNSWIIENSDWLQKLIESEPLLTHHEENLKHYLICTQTDVLEILSSDINPVITKRKT